MSRAVRRMLIARLVKLIRRKRVVRNLVVLRSRHSQSVATAKVATSATLSAPLRGRAVFAAGLAGEAKQRRHVLFKIWGADILR